MQTHLQRLQSGLLADGLLTEQEDINLLLAEASKKHVDVEEHIAQLRGVKPLVVYQSAAKTYGVEYKNLAGLTIDPSLLSLLSESIVQTHYIVVFDRDEKKSLLSVATRDPHDIQTLDFIQKKTGHELRIFYTDSSSIRHIVKQYHANIQEEIASLSEAPLSPDSFTGITGLSRIAHEVPIVKIVDTLLNYAIYQGASDIHIEPDERELHVRYRVDGVLFDVMTLPKAFTEPMVARIKVLSNLKIDEHRKPQDGRFKIEPETNKVIAFRVSILPVYDGEKVVMRILDESAKVLTFEQLGMQQSQSETLRNNIQKPNGIILVTGPTGSGKTTTLYSILHTLNKPEVNISTIEDPIEYRIPRVNQSQIAPKVGFTFAGGLRALLRQDPDIIMVGEIRDEETAQISAHSAVTGHLVLSTLHTNDAVGAISRLVEMGVPHYLVAGTTNLIIAQRLVRKLCQACRVSYHLDASTLSELAKQFNIKAVTKSLQRAGELDKGTTLDDILFFHGKGCNECNNRGYKGRIGIYELLVVDDAISQAILSQEPSDTIFAMARENGMFTMTEDGFMKAKRGETTIEEILRVSQE